MVVGGVLGALLVPPFLELVVWWTRHVDASVIGRRRESGEDLCVDCINGGSSHALCGVCVCVCVWEIRRERRKRERERSAKLDEVEKDIIFSFPFVF